MQLAAVCPPVGHHACGSILRSGCDITVTGSPVALQWHLEGMEDSSSLKPVLQTYRNQLSNRTQVASIVFVSVSTSSFCFPFALVYAVHKYRVR